MDNGRIKKSILLSYVSIIFTIISGFIYTPWLIRELGSSDYAIYTIVISLMSYFTVDFGLGATITRFIAKYRAENKESLIKGLLGIALKLYLMLDVIVLVALVIIFLFLGNIYKGLTIDEIEKLKVAYCILGGMTFFCIPVLPLNGVYIAYGRIYNVKLFELLSKIITIALVCCAIFFGYGLYLVILINAIITVLINVIKLYYIYKKEHISIDIVYKDKDVLHQLITFSIWVAIAMIADKFYFSIEPTLLGAFSNSSQVAIFAIAASIEGYVLIFADALNGVFLPQVTSMVVENKSKEEITDLLVKVGRLQLFIVSGFIFGIVTQGQEFITIWFGADYSKSYISVVIVLIPCFIHLTQGIGTEMLYATNNVKYRTLAYCLGAITNIIVTSILSPSFGAIGAAIGIMSGFVVGHEIILNIVYYKIIHLNIPRFFKECHFKMVVPGIISMAVGLGISKCFVAQGRLHILVKCGLWGLLYIVITSFLYLNKSEKDYFFRLIKRYYRKK